MFERNDLVHLVFWPSTVEGSVIDLVTGNGEVKAGFAIQKPITGVELQRFVPHGLSVVAHSCAVYGLAGGLVTITEMPFDSAVVTEKREETFEDRFAKLESRVRRSEQREAKLAKENAQLLADRAMAASESAQAERDAQAASDEVPPPDDGQQPPVTAQEGAGDE